MSETLLRRRTKHTFERSSDNYNCGRTAKLRGYIVLLNINPSDLDMANIGLMDEIRTVVVQLSMQSNTYTPLVFRRTGGTNSQFALGSGRRQNSNLRRTAGRWPGEMVS